MHSDVRWTKPTGWTILLVMGPMKCSRRSDFLKVSTCHLLSLPLLTSRGSLVTFEFLKNTLEKFNPFVVKEPWLFHFNSPYLKCSVHREFNYKNVSTTSVNELLRGDNFHLLDKLIFLIVERHCNIGRSNIFQ